MSPIQLPWFGAATGACPFRPCWRGSWETFLYTLKAGPAGGHLRRPSAAGRTSPSSGPAYRRSRTTAALSLKRAPVNLKSKCADLANNEASQIASYCTSLLMEGSNEQIATPSAAIARYTRIP
jgi:hypothetical protein